MPTPERETAIVFVTKSALSKGIEMMRVEIEGSTAFPVPLPGKLRPLGIAPKDWYRTESEAQARVLQMVDRRKKALDEERKKLARIASEVAAGKFAVVDRTKEQTR